MMKLSSRPLTKRSRAALACNTCRRTKSKCDSDRPACGRCVRQNIECLYSQNTRDKRIERREERKARWALKYGPNGSDSGLASAPTSGQAEGSNTIFISNRETEERSPPAQMSTPAVSDSGSRGTTAVDILASGAFDHRPAAEIGYFGPTSNHALFRSLTAAIANCGHRGTLPPQQESGRQPTPVVESPGPSRTPLPRLHSGMGRPVGQSDDEMFPEPLTAIQWITRFFDTVGTVLPYVRESALLREVDARRIRRENNRPMSRSVEALLNIVFAHALTTIDADMVCPFYHRALRLVLLDEQTVSNSSLETVQALLLLGSFQQNSRRAMASLSSHSLAVKTSYQLGLHSPSSYEGLGRPEKELRAKLWFAVVNQDRILSSGLGRPGLVPTQYVRTEILESLVQLRSSSPTASPSSMESLVYFRHLSCLHETMGIAVDSIYDSNIGSPSDLTPGQLTAKTIELQSRLGQWRDDISPFDLLNPKADLSTWSASKFQTERYVLVLSIYYYKTVMIVCWPVLRTVLERVTDRAARDNAAFGVLEDTFASVLKNDLQAVKELRRVVCGLLQHDSSFFKRNAVWWACNFAALTMCLHLFSLWLISIFSTSLPPAIGLTSPDAEAMLLEALDTLKTIGGASIMSSKAYKSLDQYIRLCRVIASNTKYNSISRYDGSELFYDLQQSCPLPGDMFLWDGFPGYSATSLDFGELDDGDFLTASGLGMEQGIGNLGAAKFTFNNTV